MHKVLFMLITVAQVLLACENHNPHDDLDLDSKCSISPEQVVASIESIYDTLFNQMLNHESVPFVNRSQSDLTNVKETFQSAIDAYKKHPAHCLDDLEQHLAEAFGLTGSLRDRIGVDYATIYTVGDQWKKGLTVVWKSGRSAKHSRHPLSIPLSKRDTLYLDSVKLHNYVQWDLTLGFLLEEGVVVPYLNRDQCFIRGVVSPVFDSTIVGAIGGHEVIVSVDSASAPRFMFSSGIEMQYDYFNNSAWIIANQAIPGRSSYFEGLKCFGKLSVMGQRDTFDIHLGMVNKSGEVVYEHKYQKFYSEVKEISLKMHSDTALKPFDWVVEIVTR